MKIEVKTATLVRLTSDKPEDMVVLGVIFGKIAQIPGRSNQPPGPNSDGSMSLQILSNDLVSLAAGMPISR